jgi:hypothetical protein
MSLYVRCPECGDPARRVEEWITAGRPELSLAVWFWCPCGWDPDDVAAWDRT